MDFISLTPQERRDLLAKSAQAGLLNSAPKFEVKRFYLDNARSRTTPPSTGSEHIFGSIIKSFWVCGWSGDFSAKIVPNFAADRDLSSGLPLKQNLNMPFQVPAADACLEFSAQPGVWIDVAFSDSEDIQVGSVQASLTATSTVREGNTFSQSTKTVGSSGTFVTLLTANGLRGKGTIRNTDPIKTLYLGSQAELNDANYDIICALFVPPGETFYWKNAAELRGRYPTGSGSVAVCDENI